MTLLNTDAMAHIMVNSRFNPVKVTNKKTGETYIATYPTQIKWNWEDYDYEFVAEHPTNPPIPKEDCSNKKEKYTTTDYTDIEAVERLISHYEELFEYVKKSFPAESSRIRCIDSILKSLVSIRSSLLEQNAPQTESPKYIPYVYEDLKYVQNLIGCSVVYSSPAGIGKIYGRLDAVIVDDLKELGFIIGGHIVSAKMAMQYVKLSDNYITEDKWDHLAKKV